MNEAAHHPIAKGLRWVMALMILGLLGVGLIMKELPLSPEKLQLCAWHKWAGVSVFALVWLRLLWRLTHPTPPLPHAMPAGHLVGQAVFDARDVDHVRVKHGLQLGANTRLAHPGNQGLQAAHHPGLAPI
jgi:hypothetical protein